MVTAALTDDENPGAAQLAAPAPAPPPARAGGEESRDEAAIRAALDRGDPRAAIARCARIHGPPLGRFCQALLASQAEADEAVQETLLAAYDGLTSFRGDVAIRGWLFGIARRICARRLEVRTRQNRRKPLLGSSSLDADTRAVDDLVDDARTTHAVRTALDGLRPSEREALLLRYDAELSYREVSEACGIDEATARQRVSRALSRVRAKVCG